MSIEARMALAKSLVDEFSRIVGRDGGTVRLVSASGEEIHIAYNPGTREDCADGVCILPGDELQELMSETASRRFPGVRVLVEQDQDGA